MPCRLNRPPQFAPFLCVRSLQASGRRPGPCRSPSKTPRPCPPTPRVPTRVCRCSSASFGRRGSLPRRCFGPLGRILTLMPPNCGPLVAHRWNRRPPLLGRSRGMAAQPVVWASGPTRPKCRRPSCSSVRRRRWCRAQSGRSGRRAEPQNRMTLRRISSADALRRRCRATARRVTSVAWPLRSGRVGAGRTWRRAAQGIGSGEGIAAPAQGAPSCQRPRGEQRQCLVRARRTCMRRASTDCRFSQCMRFGGLTAIAAGGR
jgi:hypothetical protein